MATSIVPSSVGHLGQRKATAGLGMLSKVNTGLVFAARERNETVGLEQRAAPVLNDGAVEWVDWDGG